MADAIKKTGIRADDFANYFCTYEYLYHQKDMLTDQIRMDAYYNAVFRNEALFKDKVVLDVGTGSGILAIWAAQAGARKVYAVEATKMATRAATLVKANNVGHIVEVIQSPIEDVTLPEKVDIIISEWMGYFLLRESMLDSVIVARDRWLKPTGAMYPSHARMILAPLATNAVEQKQHEFNNAVQGWDEFVEATKDSYGVDMGSLTDAYRSEQSEYFLATAIWKDIDSAQLLGEPAVLKSFDLLSCTLEEIQGISASYSIPLDLLANHPSGTRLCGYAGWFDVHFRGSPSQPASQDVELSTAPSPNCHLSTHWGQQVFLISPPVEARAGDVAAGNLQMVRRKENHRLMAVEIEHWIESQNGGGITDKRTKTWLLD